ncbi:Signal transduction histidine-protein kinase/phosphatase DegS [bioreactor metagenome]|uniref:Signal transduction histidine-protein kinase/phosphatase DegS n=1 Tax=bioreactor metagenome TaxID=1076179 RepID=A0A644TPW7_9ZZZZ|nr:sensor histidine kinase [Negativicutes bacterium]
MIDIKELDKIVKNTLTVIETSKSQIFDIYEAARNEMESVKKDVERIKQQTVNIIFSVDELEKRERRARLRLMEVSRNFKVYTEEDIKTAYDEAKMLQVELAVAREQEQNLRRQRDELEIRLKTLKETVEKAENLVAQVGAVLGYLGNEMGGVVTKIESLQQSQIFGAKIIKAQEEERRRVAREIHDGPAQAMANVVFRAEVCERLVDIDVERCKNELGDLREQVRSCLKETRKIIFDLRPMTLDDLGLVPTVKRFLDTMKERTAIDTNIRVLGEEKRLDSYVEIGLFRIIQEALNNVEKHAAATSIWVAIEFMPAFILASVEDDGQGFDHVETSGSESFGLLGMRERMNLLHGELSIKSAKGKGTKVMIKVPLR